MSVERQSVPPFTERVVTDYTTLPTEYVEELQKRMDDAEARHQEQHAS